MLELSVVVPAKAGTHSPFPVDSGMDIVQIESTRRMGPRFRGDDRSVSITYQNVG